MSEKVSVLIPVYNRAELVARSIRSALNQTYRNLEVIVSDNASTDDTWSAVQQLAGEDSRVRAFRNDTNLGPTRNWIRALAEATGGYVKVLFSDDWLEPTCVERLVARMQGDADVSLAFSAALVHRSDQDEPLYCFPETSWFTASDFIWRSLSANSGMPVSPCCALVRRRVARFRHPITAGPSQLNEIGEQYGAGPDLLFLLEAAAASRRVAYIPECLTHFDGGRTSITLAHWPMVSLGYELAQKQFAGEVANFPGLRNLNRRMIARRWKASFRNWRHTIKKAIGLRKSCGDSSPR
jgi:glycosyltransferase involved in cell wall biosynthesis